MNKKLLFIFVIILLIGGGGVFFARYRYDNALTPKASELTQNFKTQKNITYCTPGGTPQLLDIYTPQDSQKIHSLIIHVHGGSWVGGSKSDDNMMPVITALADKGFAVASINYRLAPDYKFPAQIQDVKCAIRYMRANASKYSINPAKIGVLGESAGGHLSALAALSQNVQDFSTAENASVSDHVSAVVDLFGPADLVSLTAGSSILGKALPTFLGSYSAGAASPTSYVDASDPPMLLIHGDSDTLVPLSQSQELLDTLQKSGVTSSLIIVKNAGHGLDLVKGDAIDPTSDEIQASAVAFYIKYL
jgi:acetyl esterase/lipase